MSFASISFLRSNSFEKKIECFSFFLSLFFAFTLHKQSHSNMSDTPDEQTNDVLFEKKELALPKPPPPPLSSASKVQVKLMSRFCTSITDDPILHLNVGGKYFSTRQSTLTNIPNTVLALICTTPWSDSIVRDDDGRIFLDFDPNLFEYLLNQLRDWSSMKKVFDLPHDQYLRQRFRSLCAQLNFNSELIDGIYRHDKFNQLSPQILLEDKGYLAIHAGEYRHAECRGVNVYSSGINRIVLILKHHEMEKFNTFIGIIWAATPMQERSFESSTAYGWAGRKHVYFKGIPSNTDGYGGYDSDMCVNDTIELTLNCQLHFISLFNYRTRKMYEIPVDIHEGCPFPWQLHINLCTPNDQMKILHSN